MALAGIHLIAPRANIIMYVSNKKHSGKLNSPLPPYTFFRLR